jgi:Short C-terminal domain
MVAELERLVALLSSGMLDDEEFRAAKARIISCG